MTKSFDNDIKTVLQKDIEIPKSVLRKAEFAFEEIRISEVGSYSTFSKSKKKWYPSKIAAAVIVLLILTGFGSGLGGKVLASINLIGTTIEEFISYKFNSLEDYKTVIDKAITENDVTVKLNEIMLDDNQIIISSTFNSSKVNWDDARDANIRVFVNGKDVLEEGGGGSTRIKRINESSCSFLHSVDLNSMKPQGDIRVKVVYDDIILKNNKKIEGPWSFKFTANCSKLAEEVKTIPINKKITLDEGQEVIIENIRISPIGATIYYSMSYETERQTAYYLDFIIKDKKGKELKFNSGTLKSDTSELTFTKAFIRYAIPDEGETMLYVTTHLKAYDIPANNGEQRIKYDKLLEDETFEIMVSDTR
jgi:hypothetical protein